MIIDFISFSARGAGVAKLIKKRIEKRGNIVRIFAYYKQQIEACIPFSDIYEQTESSFKYADSVVFISSCNVAVRAAAPFIRSGFNTSVAVLDEEVKYCIPLISGASENDIALADLIADEAGAQKIVTSQKGEDINFSIADFIRRNNLRCDSRRLLQSVSRRFLSGERVGFYSEFSHTAIPGGLTDSQVYPVPESGICVSAVKKDPPYKETLFLIPKAVTLGIVFRPGISREILENHIFQSLSESRIPLYAVEKIVTTESRQYEPALLEFSSEYGIPFETCSPFELAADEESDLAAYERCALKGGGRLIASLPDNKYAASAMAVHDIFLMF